MVKSKEVTTVSAPGLPWRVVHNGSNTDVLTSASAIRFAATQYKQGQNAYIQHFVNGDWANAESETQKALGKVAGFNPGAVSALTTFGEYTQHVLKQAPKKNGVSPELVDEWIALFYTTAIAMGVTRSTLERVYGYMAFPPEQETADNMA